ncbi:hypothetical protein [Hyalangium versicolor]|uniref:hypothetical protein n=1 Tax=Hyalangium versicolor TaxID=2861190 RepID=UPI001CCB3F90|nr:hypothetical protein [Hyalangium versicolor]
MTLSFGHVLLASLALAGSKPPPSRSATPAGGSGPALSHLKSREPEGCDWVRQPIPSGEPQTVFSFDKSCASAVVAWSRDGKQGLVFVSADGPDSSSTAWKVDLVNRTGTLLDLGGLPEEKGPPDKDLPVIEQLTFDPQGRPVALVSYTLVLHPPEPSKDGKRYISLDGENFPVVDGSGDPGLVMAYRLEGGTWKRVEAKAVNSGGFEALKLTKTLQRTASQSSVGQAQGKALAPKDPAQKLLSAAFPDKKSDGEGKWLRLTTLGGPLFYRREAAGDGFSDAAPVRWGAGNKLAPVEGVPDAKETAVSFQLQKELLLVDFSANSRPKTLILNAKTKKILMSQEDLIAPAFWPQAAKR